MGWFKTKKDQKLLAFQNEKKINQFYLDITNFKAINDLIKRTKPDLIFHLAAQPLISHLYKSYGDD